MDHIDLSKIAIKSGGGQGDNLCVMQWVARFSHTDESKRPTDHPECTSPVLTAFAIAFNDGVDDETRQKLIPFIPRLVGTAGDPAADEVRAWLATDWLVRTFTPTWLRKAGLTEDADALAALPEIASSKAAREAQPILDAARAKASAAGAAAWDAAGAAAWDAARDAAWAAARAAAGAAAWDAAGDAAGAAARAVAGAAAGAAAGDAAGDAARDAAWAAARAAAWAAASKHKTSEKQYAAARKAADDILKPLYAETIIELRESALALFSKMIDVRTAVPS